MPQELDYLDRLGIQDYRGLMESQGHLGRQAQLDRQDHLVQLDQQVQMAIQAQQEGPVDQVLRDLPDQWGHKVLSDPQVQRDRPEPMALMAYQEALE